MARTRSEIAARSAVDAPSLGTSCSGVNNAKRSRRTGLFGIAAQVGEIGGIIEQPIMLPEVMHCDATAVLFVEISYHGLYQRT